MGAIHFYLKGAWSINRQAEIAKSNAVELENYLDTKLQIICTVATVGKRLKVYTTKKIEPKNWDFDKERANTKKYKVFGITLNETLGKLETAVAKVVESNEDQGKLTSLNELRALLPAKGKIKDTVKEQKTTFATRMEHFLNEHKTKQGFPIRESTIKKYKTLEKYLNAFCASERKNLSLDEIDLNFLTSFQTFLNNKSKDDLGLDETRLCDSSKSKYLDALKAFIKFYQHPKRNLIPAFDTSEVNINASEGEIYVVPLKKIIEIQRMKFSTERLNNIRDQFCFMCWTGQRFEDYRNLKKSDIIKDEYGKKILKLSAEKIIHGKILTVPLIHFALDILERYDGNNLPIPTISNQKFNDALKELGQEAKLDFEVVKVKYYNGKSSRKTFPFYKILSSHVARKSYITNSLMLGVPERIVREISDHKDEKSFRRYIQFADNYKTAAIHNAYSSDNVERVLNLIGDNEIYM
jgi:integrase